MSTRQRARLRGIVRQGRGLEGSEGESGERREVVRGWEGGDRDEAEESDEAEDESRRKNKMNYFEIESSSDESMDEIYNLERNCDEEECKKAISHSPQQSIKSRLSKKKQQNVSTYETERKRCMDDDDYLDHFLSSRSSEDDTFLHVNPNGLDIDAIFHRKLGRHMTDISRGTNVRRTNNIRQRRNQVFGLYQEEWPKPVTYLNGGLQMVDSSPPVWWEEFYNNSSTSPPLVQWYRFKFSIEYSKKQDDFEIIKNSGDINLLILFLSVNPTHVDSLIHLSTLFTRLGEMDRGSDLIRRCIYYHELAYANTFHPDRNLDHAPCCLTWDSHENQSFFNSLFLHFQVVWMKGFLIVALDLLKVILSLNPMLDPKHTLLLLDKLLLLAGRYEEIDSFCRSSSSRVLGLPMAQNNEFLVLHEIFPNWAYSFAISRRLQEKKRSKATITSDRLLLDAIRRFPFVLKVLFDGVTMPSVEKQQWERLQSHPFFQYFSSLERFSFLLMT